MDIYRRYGPALVRKCTRMLGNIQDAEDIVQGLFVDLLKKGKDNVDLPYLYRAVTNRSLNCIRNRNRRRQLLGDQCRSSAHPQNEGYEYYYFSREALTRLVAVLDKKSTEIMVYRFCDNMTQEEIAQLTGYSRKTIGKKLAGISQKAEHIFKDAPLVNNGNGRRL